MADNSGPLSGVKVLELGTLIAAPFAARIMAEFGAEVIKVEQPIQGDPLRRWRKMHDGTSLWWYLQSRNKKCIALDLKAPEGKDVIKKLVAECDVVIENFRPGGLEKLGLGWDVLSAINPKLTMVRISGYGQDGPYRLRPGFGAIGEAMGGIRFTTGNQESAPARVGISLGDSLASLHGVIGALMSLLVVKTGKGEGQVIDVSLYESVFNLMESIVPEYSFDGHIRRRSGGSLPGIAPSNTYRTSDGQFVVIAGNSDAIFKRLMHVVGRPDMAIDECLAYNDGRVKHVAMIDDAIEGWTLKHTISAVLEKLELADIPASKIYTVADIVTDEQYVARDMILDTQLPGSVTVKMPGITPKLSRTPGSIRWIGPKLGEHTDEVLADIGYDEQSITRIKESGAAQ